MQSNDRNMLLDSINLYRKDFSEFKSVVLSRLDNIELSQQHLTDRIDWLQTTIYWGFALITVIIALFTLWLSTPRGSRHKDSVQASQTQPIILQIPPYPYFHEKDKQSA